MDHVSLRLVVKKQNGDFNIGNDMTQFRFNFVHINQKIFKMIFSMSQNTFFKTVKKTVYYIV